MTVDFVYTVMQGIINKNQQGYFKPQDFNNFINLAQYGFLDYLLGEFQSYQGGRPVPKVQFGMNESVRQRLTPFIKPPVTLTVDGTGLSPYPSDYQQGDAMYDVNMNRIRYVPQHKLYSYLGSVIDLIATNPVFEIQSNGFQFYPITQGSAKLSYVGTPTTIVWGFLPDVNGRPVYNPGTSTDPSWYDVDMQEVIARALKMVGVNLRAQEVSQYGSEIKQAGQ